jgi:hypothetical protein
MPAMPDDPKEALSIFANAIRDLLQNKDLAYADPGERAIVATLSDLLSGKFPGWTLGVEWDRYEQEVKQLRYKLSDEEFEREAPIIPDLIVHRVGKRENLLVVEVKRAVNRNYKKDIWKLRGLTQQEGKYGYAAGLHLVLDIPAGKVARCDVYVDAELDAGLTGWTREQLP